jgi:chromosome partitioning protein
MAPISSKPVIVSCVNLKGGVGKTAIAVNLAAYAGQRRHLRTLLIDLDPQTNASIATMGYDNWERHQQENGTLADILGLKRHLSADDRTIDIATTIVSNVFENVDLLPSHLDLFTIDLDLAGAAGRERRLRKALLSHLEPYDLVVCDCPPNLTLPTQNALTLSTHYLIPVSPDFLSALGVALLIDRINEFCSDVDHTLERIGIVLSRMGRPARHREQIVAALRDRFDDVLESEIKERVVVSETAESSVQFFNQVTPARETNLQHWGRRF